MAEPVKVALPKDPMYATSTGLEHLMYSASSSSDGTRRRWKEDQRKLLFDFPYSSVKPKIVAPTWKW